VRLSAGILLVLLGAAAEAGAGTKRWVVLQAWIPACSNSDEAALKEAAEGARLILKGCGIGLKMLEPRRLDEGERTLCELPDSEDERRPLLAKFTRPLRLKNPRGLSLFMVPTGIQARYSFAVIDRSPKAGCASPKDPSKLADYGSLFMSDFALKGEPGLGGRLLAHEIAHALTNQGHPTGAPRGMVLADHVSDMGGSFSNFECVCMIHSPFISRKP
jgi:hypothetical protein